MEVRSYFLIRSLGLSTGNWAFFASFLICLNPFCFDPPRAERHISRPGLGWAPGGAYFKSRHHEMDMLRGGGREDADRLACGAAEDLAAITQNFHPLLSAIDVLHLRSLATAFCEYLGCGVVHL